MNPDDLARPELLAASLSQGSGQALSPGSARTIATLFASCCNCGESFGDEVAGGKESDRDVVFNVSCPSCSTEQSVLVEEKIWGIISADQTESIPDDAVTYDLSGKTAYVGSVPVEYSDTVLFLNPRGVLVSPGVCSEAPRP